MSLKGYQEALDSQRQKEDQMQEMKDRYEHDMKAIREEMNQQFSKMMLMMQQNPQLAYIKPEVLKEKTKRSA
jgi:integrase/recombinase XerD